MKAGNFTAMAKHVLREMQRRDYPLLDRQVDCAKDVNLKDLTFGRLALSIPQDHYEVLSLIYPDLQSPDAEIKTKAWKAFCMTDESIPYKPNKLERGH